MADCKEIVGTNVSSPEFIRELFPAAKRTALLYHMSYLCLGGFPKLERLLRQRAIETQQLFGSSEALLMKCTGTSENLVKSLLPFLKVAVEKNNRDLARSFLEKAKGWIEDIINDVKEIVTRYNEHNSDVAKSTSDIITEKDETEKQQQQQTIEMEALQKIIDGLEGNLQKINTEIEDYDKKIEQKNAEIQKFINSITNSSDNQTTEIPEGISTAGSKLSLFSIIVPFMNSIFDFFSKIVLSSSQESVVKTLQTGLSELTSAQQHLKEREWDTQNNLMDKQLQLSKLKIANGQMPSVTHLGEVQKCLSRIQHILLQLQKFWEKVGSHMDKLKKSTMAGEDCINYLEEMKEDFLDSIKEAKEEWKKFGISCVEANQIFSVQSSQAYKFLEVSPSSLSKEDWEKEYENVKKKLEKITPSTVSQNAITE